MNIKRLFPFAAVMAIVTLGQGCATPAAPSPAADVSAPPASDSSTSSQTNSAMTAPAKFSFPGVLPESETNVKIRIKTTKGDIVVQMSPDQGPNAASNFVYLVKNKFYDGLTFHRREEGFVIQGGDPSGNGTGGPGYQFADDAVKPVGENPYVTALPDALKAQLPSDYVMYKRGTLAMANAGANTNGSQFFIMLGDMPLAPSYSIFGHVTEGMDVVDRIQVGDTMTSVSVE